MIRKTQRLFPKAHHEYAGRKLAKIDTEIREFIQILRGCAKARSDALKTQFWINRLRSTLDNQLLRDFPGDHSPAIYFPKLESGSEPMPKEQGFRQRGGANE